MATATISAQFTNYLSSDKWQPLHGKMSNLHTDNHLEKKILTEKQQPKHRQTKITKMIFNCRDEKLLQSTTENMPTDGWVGRMMVNQTVWLSWILLGNYWKLMQ